MVLFATSLSIVNLYNSFTLIRTTLYIVHGQFVSLYNIQESKWEKHCRFMEGEINCLVKKWTKVGTRIKHELIVLLENGAYYNNMQKVFFAKRDEEVVIMQKVMIVENSHKTAQLEGKLIRVS